ncbi:T9SS type A sorting domain-containing protein, partial [bacterium]|nr:T9SS type A sorting domain-containing protein [bacterium]
QDTLSGLCFVHNSASSGEIHLGEGTVHSWNSTIDVYLPSNRKNWAIGLAVSHSMFNNLIGSDLMSINEYFATGIQETNCGCDGGIIDPSWVTNPYPDHENNNPVFCYDYTHGVAAGFFQEEYGTGWLELNQDIPCFIPTFNFDSTIVGKNFSAQLIGKVYHDYNNLMFLQYIKCFDVIEFMQNCSDPYGPEKLIAAIYNRGMNTGFIEDVLVTNRAAALASNDLLLFIPGLGQQYAEQISRVTAVLDNNMAAVSSYGTNTYNIPWVGNHSSNGFYDTQISWVDVTNYLDELKLVYQGVGVNMMDVKNAVQPIFDTINGGGTISYRYQLEPVIEAIVLALPIFEPMSGLGSVYGNSGGNSCNFPTARMEQSTTICEGESTQFEIFLTGQGPWDITYNYAGTDVNLTNITTSPYILSVSNPGLYYLTFVEDNSNTVGQIICDSVVLTVLDSTVNPCTPTILPVDFGLFNAKVIDHSSVHCSWNTFSEHNNDFFTVQRSINLETWENIARIEGAGNSNQLIEYESIDFHPHSGTSYYRIKQTDFNAAIGYSNPRPVRIKNSTVSIYPNPSSNYLKLKGPMNRISSFKILNVIGQEVNCMERVIGENEIQIDISVLSSGMYLISTKGSSLKFVKN